MASGVSDRLVTPRHVLKAVMELERRGSRRVLTDLEGREPDLAEFLLENLTRLYHDLSGFGLAGKEVRKAYKLAEKTALVCLLALRGAHRELWDPPGQGELAERDAEGGPRPLADPLADSNFAPPLP